MRSLIAMVCATGSLLAVDDPRLGGPVTYATPTPDGNHLFVMIAPRPTNPHPAQVPEKQPHEKALYAKYAATGSGLYRNDGSTTPLWTVDWYSFRVFPANDAVHLVRMHGEFPLSESFPATKRLSDETVAAQVNEAALSFYAGGKLLKIYTVRELIKNVDVLPHSLEHVLWSANGVITRDDKQFGLITQDSRQIYFDLATGTMVIDREAGLGNAQVWVVRISIAITSLAGVIIVLGWLYKSAQDKKKNLPSQ